MTKFIAHDGNLIYAVADTQEEALAAARRDIGEHGEVNENWPEPQASINATLDRLAACKATDALIAEIEARGGAIATAPLALSRNKTPDKMIPRWPSGWRGKVC